MLRSLRFRPSAWRTALVALLLVTGASVAHARPLLEHTSPTSVSAIHEAPSKISLSFSDALVPSHTDAVVRNASGGIVSSGKARVMGKEGKIEVPVKPLSPGKYRVEWYATAADKRPAQGSYNFVVGAKKEGKLAGRHGRRKK